MVSILKNLFKTHEPKDLGIKFNGIYVSEPNFERLDQTWFVYYFQFYPNGKVRCRIAPEKFNVADLYSEKEGLQSKYRIKSGRVTFIQSLPEYNFKSTWVGTISDDSITFTIENPDYEDIDGEYKFIPSL